MSATTKPFTDPSITKRIAEKVYLLMLKEARLSQARGQTLNRKSSQRSGS